MVVVVVGVIMGGLREDLDGWIGGVEITSVEGKCGGLETPGIASRSLF